MFKHILKKRTTTIWEWGPVAEHRIPLDEIDSAHSQGRMTVMELLVHPMAHEETQKLLSDDYMKGFLWKRYKAKWYSFVRLLFVLRLILLSAFVIIISIIAAPSVVMVQGLSSTIPATGTIAARDAPLLMFELVLTSVLAAIELVELVLSFLDREVRPPPAKPRPQPSPTPWQSVAGVDVPRPGSPGEAGGALSASRGCGVAVLPGGGGA